MFARVEFSTLVPRSVTLLAVVLVVSIANLIVPALAVEPENATTSPWTETSDRTPAGDRLIALDLTAIKGALVGVEDEWNPIDSRSPVTLEIPLPDGSRRRFSVVESSIMEPELAKQFPAIKTYAGRGLDDPSELMRFDLGPLGFHAIILSTTGTVYIEPAGTQYPGRYISSFQQLAARGQAVNCTLDSSALPPQSSSSGSGSSTSSIGRHNAGSLRIFRLAAAATGEFTAQNGGTVDSAMAAITTVVNSANAIYRRDLTIFFDLIAGSRQMIYTNGATDPYTSLDLTCNNTTPACSSPPAPADCLWTENQCNADAVIGNANYDLSVVFDATNASGGGTGRAFLQGTCDNSNKGRAATAGTIIDLFAHEVGHMFSARHTFNDNANGACASLLGANQRDPLAASEPGSGSSLMSYCGSCGAANLQPARDQVFDGNNLLSMLDFVDTGNASNCWGYAGTGNLSPVILSFPSDTTIPKSTPFELKVDAYDSQGDTISYSWEQADVSGAASPPETDDGTRPILRSYAPNNSPSRLFPSRTYLRNNQNVPPATYNCGLSTPCLVGETLPSTNRTMKFNLVLRDNVDGITVASVNVTSSAAAGPFQVISPSSGSEQWTEGAKATVTWAVAGTNAPPVNCAAVNIWLSRDDGVSFPYLLAGSSSNDGNESVQVPFGTTSQARVRVECASSIFFDISDTGFAIVPLHVYNTDDSGPGSLRQAIIDANNSQFARDVPFDIPGAGLHTINVLSPLPALLNENQSLDGWRQGGPEYSGPPLIELNGAACADGSNSTPCDGLTISNNAAIIRGFTINRFKGNGIHVSGGGVITAAFIQNNYIGTDAGGTSAAPNKLSGVRIDGGSDAQLNANLISGNLEAGVFINGASTSGTLLIRNKIGCDLNGTTRVPNELDGVRIVGSPGNRIGDAIAGDANWISGNGKVIDNIPYTIANGVSISGATANGNSVQNNRIGLDATGNAALDNSGSGILVNGAPNTVIGGSTPLARNLFADRGVIARGPSHGIEVHGAGSTGLKIQGNYIGTNAAGSAGLCTRGAAIYVDGSPGVQIGGTTSDARNVMCVGHSYGGIQLMGGASGAVIQGNYIGTDATGSYALPNGSQYSAIYIASGSHTIGGAAPGARNLISGSQTSAVWIDGIDTSNNAIVGNYVGTNAAGTAAVPNFGYGIKVTGANGTIIGGTAPSAGNLISNNGAYGISLEQYLGQHCTGSVIQGNKIGTNAAGTVAMPNGVGISLYEVSGITIGGGAAGAGNLISASANGIGSGIYVYSFGHVTSGITIQGNKIGTDITGNVAMGNIADGIYAGINGTMTIGGAGAGNVISANGGSGIAINGPQASLTILGNLIGAGSDGVTPLFNRLSGIYVSAGSNHVIGGIGSGEGNQVSFNSNPNYGYNYAGINLLGGIGTVVRGNRIFGNTGSGLDLSGLGSTPNDNCDLDSGEPNDIQNFPLIDSAGVSGGSTRITGRLNSNPNASFTLDFYSNSSCDPSGYGEGERYLGSATVNTDSTCNGSFDVTLPTPMTGVVVATATNGTGSTSEFSACSAVSGGVAEVNGLRWVAGTTNNLSWDPAAGATTYKLIRGIADDLPKLLTSSADGCTRYSGGATSTGPILSESPAVVPRRAYWYLVIGNNGLGDGPAGNATAGPRQLSSSGVCP